MVIARPCNTAVRRWLYRGDVCALLLHAALTAVACALPAFQVGDKINSIKVVSGGENLKNA